LALAPGSEVERTDLADLSMLMGRKIDDLDSGSAALEDAIRPAAWMMSS